ncbi:sulfotransferase family protein, partial [bacterium]|nr:sulfotransferase family protein [bacterium]
QRGAELATEGPLVFVHVPKTAGTSFRMALERLLGFDAMAYDYGPDSEVTSPIIMRHVYDRQDLKEFKAAVLDGPVQVVCGHFPAEKYRDLFGPENALVFLRDPVQRLISEYRHYVTYNGYVKGFEEFYRDPAFTNCQKAFVQGIPLDRYGFLGITERYEASLEMANRRFGWKLMNLSFNQSRPTLEASYGLEGDLVQDLLDRNAEDIAFYGTAVEEFERRAQALS